MKWFRVWSSVRHHPKLLKLAALDRWNWLVLLCVANEAEPRGSLPSNADLALELRVSQGKAASVVTRFREAGLLDYDEALGRHVVHDWDEWQPVSDDAAARMAAYRSERSEHVQNRDRTSSERGPNALRTSSPPETDTETEDRNRSRRQKQRERTVSNDVLPLPEEEEEEGQPSVERVRLRLHDSSISIPPEGAIEEALSSGIECVLHCIDEAVLHNKPSWAYAEAVRQRHVNEGCPPPWEKTRAERMYGAARRQA